LTADSGAGAKLGDFKGRVAGIGPQIGFLFPLGQGLPGLSQREAKAVAKRPARFIGTHPIARRRNGGASK
jgi:hypothetical protein